MTTGAGPAQDIVQKFIEEEEKAREAKIHVALQVGKVCDAALCLLVCQLLCLACASL
jgi:hypothetical protein